MAPSDLNFWSGDQTDSPSFDLPPLDSNNFFTSSNFRPSLPPDTEEDNRVPALPRRRAETDGDEGVEDDNRNEGLFWRQTQVDGDEEHMVDGNSGWEDSNRFMNDGLCSHLGPRQGMVGIDNETTDSSDLEPINKLHPSKAVRDTDDIMAGAMSGTFRYVHNEMPFPNSSAANSDDSFSVPSIDSRKQLKGRVVRKVETDHPMVDPLQAMKKPETEMGVDEEKSTDMGESQVSVITQETEDFPSVSVPSTSTLRSSVMFHPAAVTTVSHTLRDSQMVTFSSLSTSMALHPNSSTLGPPLPQTNISLFNAAPVPVEAANFGPSQPTQHNSLLPCDNTMAWSLPSRPQNRGVTSLPSSVSAPVSPSSQFLDASQRVAALKARIPLGKVVLPDSPCPANVHQLPGIVGPKHQLTPALTNTPENLPLPLLATSYGLSQVSDFECDQLLSLPSHINDGQGNGSPLHYQHHTGYNCLSVDSQFCDQPMSLSLSSPPMTLPTMGVSNFAQPHVQPEQTATEETYNNVKHMTEGSEEFITPLDSLSKAGKTSLLIKLTQQYMQDKSEGILTCPSTSATQQAVANTPSTSHQHDNDNLMKKELDKAFERISDLEVRVQDLTLQLTVELPDDNEITHLSLEKLQQEYKRMKELKRRAEQQNIEARMSAQRLIAENHRLKEELAQVKDDRQATLQQLMNVKKEVHSRQQDASKKAQSMKLAVTLAITDGGHTGSLSLQSVTATAFPSMTITMEVFSSIIASETINYSCSLIITFGQASAGKTSLLRAIDNLADGPVIPRGQQSSLQVYDILASRDTISTETKWSPQLIQGYISNLFAMMVTKSCSKKKRSPSFDVDENTEGRPALPRTKVDFYKKKIYESVKRVVDTMEGNGQLSDLNISTPSSLTFFDLELNTAASMLLPHLLSQSKPPILLDAVSLEDVQSLLAESRFGSLNQEDEAYMSLTSEELPLHLPSHLENTLDFAKTLQKQQQRESDSVHPVTLIVACTHTDSFARDKKVQDMVRKLKYRVVLAAAERGIKGNFNLYAVSVCQNDNYSYDNASLLKLKRTIEKAAGSSGSVSGLGEVPARWVLLQGILLDHGKNHLSLAEVAHYGRECGIVLEEELHQFLALQHESGNLLYLPHAKSQLLRGVVITDVVQLLEKILRLFYYQRQLIEVGSGSQTSLPPSGISDSTLRTVVQEDSDVIIHLLSEFKLCETDMLKGMEKSYTLFPQLLLPVS